MLYHPADPTLYLIECADLEAERPPDVVQMHSAILSQTVAWAREYICKPNRSLGRTGAVCPFVETAMKQGQLFITVPDPHAAMSQVSAIVSRYCEWFPMLEPRSGGGVQFNTILILFPGPDVTALSRTIEAVQARLKPSCVAHGLMIGEFHPGPPAQPGLWNRAFRPFFSPIPLLGIRHMVSSDFGFVENDPSLVLEYLRRFGNEVPSHIRNKVKAAACRFGIQV